MECLFEDVDALFVADVSGDELYPKENDMTQKAKQHLRGRLIRPDLPFSFGATAGGIAGSLVGLGFITKAKGGLHYITSAGLKWIGRQRHR